MRGSVLVCMIVCLLSAHIEAQTELTVEKAIELGLQNNEQYLMAKNQYEKARYRVIEAQSSALPQFEASLSYIRNWELPTYVIPFGENGPQEVKFGTTNNYTAGLTLTQPIYVGGKVFTALSIAKTYRKLTQEQLRLARQNLELQVIKAFYSAVMANEMLRVYSQAEQLAAQGLDVTLKMFNQGLVSDYEVLRAQVRLANARPARIDAEAGATLATKNLNNLIGLPINSKPKLVTDMNIDKYLIPPLDLDSARIAMLEKRPEIKMVDYQNEIYKKMVSIAWGGWRPSVFFLTSLQYQAQNDLDRFPKSADFKRSSYSGIAITVPLFDSWRTISQVKQAKIDLSQSRLLRTELEENLVLELEQCWWNYQKAKENLTAGTETVEMARRGLEIARLRFENGVGTQLEMFDAEVALTAAETNKIIAFNNLVTGLAALLKALGEENLTR